MDHLWSPWRLSYVTGTARGTGFGYSLHEHDGRGAQGQDIAFKLAEIPVGIEPRCVALHPNAHEA